jgi:hypothetical protein
LAIERFVVDAAVCECGRGAGLQGQRADILRFGTRRLAGKIIIEVVSEGYLGSRGDCNARNRELGIGDAVHGANIHACHLESLG